MTQTGFNFATVSDDNDSLQSKQGGKFGLNTNCTFSLIDFTDKAGKDNSDGNAVDINILIGDREYKRRVYDPEGKNLYGKNNTQVAPGEEGYQELLNAELNQTTAMLVHAVKAAGVTPEALNTTLAAAKPASFAAFVQICISLLPADYKKRPIDVFLQYQWAISDGQTRTFLELPKNMKQKYWVVPSTPGVEWKEIRDEKGIIYIDDKGNKHKIEKSASFVESNFAKQQNLTDSVSSLENAGSADKSEW